LSESKNKEGYEMYNNRSFKIFRAVAFGGALLAGVSLLPLQALASTLTVMQTEAPRSMDPGDQTATYTASVLDPMYDGLLERTEENPIAPALATEWSSDDTGLVWTFKLRQGVKFHDGTPFNADAVVKNYARHLDPKRGLAASGRIRQVIEKVEAVDEYTVRFTLKKRYPAFLPLLTQASSWMVSPKADAAGTLGAKAVGTGPYKLKEYKSGEYVLEEKNPDYWRGTPKGADEIKWTWTSEPSVMNMAIQTGDADVVNPLPPAFATQLSSNEDVKVVSSDGAAVFWVALNTKIKPLDDARVRQALNYATDREGLVRVIMQGYAVPANSPLPPVMTGYDKSLNPYPLDLDKAKALLAEAGLPDGFSMSVAVQEPEARIGELLQAMWAKIGVKLDVRRMESGVWTKAAFADPAGKAADNIGSVIASWSTINAPDLQLRPLYYSASAAPAGANLGFFSDPKLDKLLDDATNLKDEGERNKLYVEAQKAINAEAPHVLLYTTKDVYAIRKGVEGVGMIPGGQVVVETATKN
jgi:glutathione transport system substrate-binding protein